MFYLHFSKFARLMWHSFAIRVTNSIIHLQQESSHYIKKYQCSSVLDYDLNIFKVMSGHAFKGMTDVIIMKVIYLGGKEHQEPHPTNQTIISSTS